MFEPSGLPRGNRILDRILPLDAQDLFARARVVSLERSSVTTEHDRRMGHVDFPVSAMLSIIGSVADGSSCELATAGVDGFVEIDAALHNDVAKRSAVCLLEGDVIRVPLADFQRALAVMPKFAERVYRAVRARVYVTEQLVLCNARHAIVERLARWLAMARLRSLRNEFPVTHEFLASMLGIRRAGVSEAIALLQARGAITHRRNVIAIADLDALVAAACECYGAARDAIAEATA
jgi:CRP-like cAMP-binding protein